MVTLSQGSQKPIKRGFFLFFKKKSSLHYYSFGFIFKFKIRIDFTQLPVCLSSALSFFNFTLSWKKTIWQREGVLVHFYKMVLDPKCKAYQLDKFFFFFISFFSLFFFLDTTHSACHYNIIRTPRSYPYKYRRKENKEKKIFFFLFFSRFGGWVHLHRFWSSHGVGSPGFFIWTLLCEFAKHSHWGMLPTALEKNRWLENERKDFFWFFWNV